MYTIMIFSLLSGILLSILVYLDMKKHPQAMPIMEIVWPLTMLWASWIGLAAYMAFGRQKKTMKPMTMNNAMPMDSTMPMDSMQTTRPKWQGITLSTLHCGAGCVLADIVGESVAAILGMTMISGWILDYLLALLFGVYFQYMAIRQMAKVTLKMALDRAIKADFLSLTAWQIGMYGFMGTYLAYFAGGGINRISFEFWFIMQLAMITGFIFSYPMNILLIKKGLKHAM